MNLPEPECAGSVILVDKPIGRTSFAVVQRVRHLIGIKKVGHAGTLDPFASGLLILCVGRSATRHIDEFMSGCKTYEAILQLGQETETQDPEGKITAVRPVPALNEQDIVRLLAEFVGLQLQAPPPYSAAKHQGKPLYHYARQGIVIEKEAKSIEIYSIALNSYDAASARLAITVACSRGTYIRVLAADIGRRIGCGAHLVALRRTHSGGFTVTEAVDGATLFSGTDDAPLAALEQGALPLVQALAQCSR